MLYLCNAISRAVSLLQDLGAGKQLARGGDHGEGPIATYCGPQNLETGPFFQARKFLFESRTLQKMSVAQHCQCLTRALFSWEAHVHADLGLFPSDFQTCCREHVAAYLTSLEVELRADLEGVQEALKEIRLGSKDKTSDVQELECKAAPLGASEENTGLPEKHGRSSSSGFHA